MKKIIYIIGVILFAQSCSKNEVPVNYAIISGQILNNSEDKLIVSSNPLKFRKEIKLDENGFFKDTLKLKEGGYSIYNYANHTGKKSINLIPVYLKTGDDLKINFDEKDYLNTMTFTGKGTDYNNYWFNKTKIEKEQYNNGKEASLNNETQYVAIISKIENEITQLINSTKSLPTDFKSREKRLNRYAYLYRLSNYERLHSYNAKQPEFKVSPNFLDDLKELAYDNYEDFQVSSIYKGLIRTHITDEVTKLIDGDKSLIKEIATLQAYNNLPNESIKNALLFQFSQTQITYSENFENFYAEYNKYSTNEENNKLLTEAYEKLKLTAKGEPSPKFANYENANGGTTSLNDLQGKYVYIDVWATWCGPCLKEVPSLKKVENNYHDKNITFLSVSIDKDKDHDKWLKMIKDKELGGVQVLADNEWQSKFVQDYSIKGIPRFILLDPKGKIVTATAPRPSDPKLIDLFNEQGI